jgi:mannosyltransferase OCH1-like enzyme
MNPDYHHIIYDDKECHNFVEQYYPQFVQVYKNLPRKVMQADMWRLLILHHYGGVYLDMDVECKKPIEQWGESFGIIKLNGSNWSTSAKATNNDGGDDRQLIQLMAGIEFEHSQFTNWAIAANPNHPILYKAVEMIVQRASTLPSLAGPANSNTTKLNDDEVIQMSGPKLFSAAIIQHFVNTGYFPDNQPATVGNATFWHKYKINTLVGDVAILNKQGFGYNGDPGSMSELFVRHGFAGRWRDVYNSWNKKKKKRKKRKS